MGIPKYIHLRAELFFNVAGWGEAELSSSQCPFSSRRALLIGVRRTLGFCPHVTSQPSEIHQYAIRHTLACLQTGLPANWTKVRGFYEGASWDRDWAIWEMGCSGDLSYVARGKGLSSQGDQTQACNRPAGCTWDEKPEFPVINAFMLPVLS